jgi:hypothetical protein
VWWLSTFLVLTVFEGLGKVEWSGWIETALGQLRATTASILTFTGATIAAFAVAIVALIGRYGGSALDVMLDVDNYLRSTPEDRTPRARIAERYASLLRHVATRGAHGSSDADTVDSPYPYDAVVVVAHSLGGLITADLFRFLRTEARAGVDDPALRRLGVCSIDDSHAAIPVYLFTMGTPLRQLNRFFPHLYQWVREQPEGTTRGFALPTLCDDGVGPPIEEGCKPFPAELGVVQWRNAYRSGDYVGRSLWLDDWYERSAGGDELYVARSASGNIHEMCIGLGAHTHYWDRTAPEIARQLDDMIARA